MVSESRARRGSMARRRWAIGVALVALAVFEFAAGQDMNSYCGYYTNCGACVADTRCGWCGNDPHGTGGYGDVNTGDHIEAIAPGTLKGGIGRISTLATDTVTGVNTRFTQQFIGKAGFNIDIDGTAAVVDHVVSDTELTLVTGHSVSDIDPSNDDPNVWFGYTKREGTGSLALDTTLTPRPNSATTETRTITGTSTVFTKELKVGYWLTFYSSNAVDYRVITEIESDTTLKVDRALPSGWTATATNWGYVSCPPRIGKRAVGLGTIESYHTQSGAVHGMSTLAASTKAASATPYDDTGHLVDASGSATMSQHIIHGKGTRFESQFGLASTWDAKFHESGPWMSVQINGDWETVRVAELGTTTTFAEYVALLENSFSEPILKATHWEWFPMLTKGYGTVRSYGKRVVSNSWDNKEGFEDIQGTAALAAGSLSSQGTYGDTRFLTQLRTGYTITACGQTRMVNSIQSDVELTIDRPFTLGNREFVPTTGDTAKLTTINVRGLTRLLPLWPRGVTIVISPSADGTLSTSSTFTYTTYWKTFANDVSGAVTVSDTAWTEISDSGVSTGLGVYVKWDLTGSPTASTTTQWRLHVADIENCRYYISTEGERYMTDDNAAPPVCYNHGKCVPANSADSQRPVTALTGTVTVNHAAGTLTGSSTKFLTELSPGDIVRDSAASPLDTRVVSITSDTAAVISSPSGSDGAVGSSVLKCAGGKFDSGNSGNHDDTSTHVADDEAGAYLPHPLHSFYQTWSHKYCEIDPGCCGFRVSSIVDPQRYAYYFVKPDHGDYNFRIAVHTVNDNLDLYAYVGATQPISTTSGVHTSVRESVPWAIDVDEADVICAGETGSDYASGHLDQAVLGGHTSDTTKNSFTYATALGHYIHVDESPNCDQITIGVMGDNRYPQTVGASEYSARVYMEFNFPNFDCAIDGSTAESNRGANATYTSHCVRHNLRFSGDAQAVQVPATAADSTSRYVVRLTEAFMRTASESSSGRTVWSSSTDFRTSQRVGAVWWHRKVHIWDGFETNFEFRITSPTQCGAGDGICDGADGFAFVISNDDRQENVTSPWSNTGWACDHTDPFNTGETYTLCGYGPNETAIGHGFVGCPGDGLGYGESTQVDSADFGGVAANCRSGLKKSLAVEFDTFYNVERRDPKQGKQHWWINATEYVSYNDNHLGVFMSTAPFYANQPWPLSSSDIVEELKADHSDDKEGAHFGSTPSVPTMADGLTHTVKIRYTRGFTTQKAGSGTITTTDSSAGSDKRALVGSSTKFKTELRTGFEFGYGGRVKANVKVQINRDQTLTTTRGQSGNIINTGFGDDNEACRVVSISSDIAALLEDISTGGSDPDPPDAFRELQHVPFDPVQGGGVSYDIIKEFPGEIQVFIDDMDRYVFQVAVEDRDMAKVLDTDGNAFIGLTASTGSKGFAKVGYQAAEVHQNHDILSWNYCSSPGCVPY